MLLNLLTGIVALAAAAQVTAPSPPPAPPPASSLHDPLAPIRAALAAGHLPAAEQSLRARIAANPQDAAARYLLGYTLFREQKPRESLAAFTAAAQLRSPTPDEFVLIASDYVLLKDLPDAEKWLRRATADDPANSNAWYLLGRTQYNQDHPADAVTAFQRCLALHPRDGRAQNNLGLAYERLQKPEEAIAAYQRAIAWQTATPPPTEPSAAPSAPRDAQPYLNLGNLLLRRGDASAALPSLLQAATLAPRNPSVQQQLGLALEQLGRLPEAAEALRRAAVLAPGIAQPHFFLGRVLRRLGRKSEADREFAVAAQLSGAHSGAETPNPDPAGP